MLLKGGSAVDAAIAAAATIALVEPVSCGLGGDAFAIVWDGKTLQGLNSSGYAPQAWNVDYFKNKYGVNEKGLANAPKRGVDAITISGVRFGNAAFASATQEETSARVGTFEGWVAAHFAKATMKALPVQRSRLKKREPMERTRRTSGPRRASTEAWWVSRQRRPFNIGESSSRVSWCLIR